MRKIYATLIAATAVGALALTGCSSNSESSGSSSSSATSAAGSGASSPSVSSSLAALVPSKIKSSGTLIVGVNVPYAPNEYKDPSGKIIGFDVDLLDAVAGVLGLKTEVHRGRLRQDHPGRPGAAPINIGMSSFTDTKEREQTVDFVTYFSAGIEWAAQAGKTVDPNNACGLTVAVQTSTTEDTDDLPAKSKACTDAGKPAIKKLQYDSQDDATNALVLGKVDAMSADSPVTAYAIKQSGGKLTAAGKIYEAAPYGWPIAKGSTLVKAIQGAIQSLISNGTYGTICQKWGVQDGEITTAQVNGATS